jgi:DNA-binding CsgD family transcriptional regulator
MIFPAGIESGFEIYLHGDHIRALIDGRRYEFDDLPSHIRSIFLREMAKDKSAITTLKLMGCKSIKEMLLKFVGCRYGALNGVPDLEGYKTTADAPGCGHMGLCPGYGIVCRIPDHLTRQEYQVTVYVGKGKLDKEICSILGIALPTLRTYYARIHEKLKINNRIEIALWAQNLGIV